MKRWAYFLCGVLAFSAAQAQTLARIQRSQALTIGVREASGALSYALPDERHVGFHVELCQRVAEDLRRSLKLPKLALHYQPVTSQNRIVMLQNDSIDIECGSTTNDLDRLRDAAFAVTTFVEEVRVAVKADSGITSIAQLNGKRVVTVSGTTAVKHLRRHEKATGIDFIEDYDRDHDEAFRTLQSGRADAFVMDRQILLGLMAQSGQANAYRLLDEVLSVEPIAIMLRKDDPAFKAAVDASLKAMMASGAIDQLYAKWFTQAIPPSQHTVGLPASPATLDAWRHPNDRPMESYRH